MCLSSQKTSVPSNIYLILLPQQSLTRNLSVNLEAAMEVSALPNQEISTTITYTIGPLDITLI
jgi:hypothetical protein